MKIFIKNHLKCVQCNVRLFRRHFIFQVISDEGIPVKNWNEVRCVLVSALASNGQTADALKIYDEMKQAECDLDCKAVFSLIVS